jgi:hypothetical protein
MRIITAVENFESELLNGDITCFLAGGITKCWDWQKAVIAELNKFDLPDHFVIFNPRREKFPINDPNASFEQISWEFKYLNSCDIFSMYFVNSESDQPICMYELGRNLMRMKLMYPISCVNRVIITCEDGYSRYNDVKIQSRLALGADVLTPNPSAKSHAEEIYKAFIQF